MSNHNSTLKQLGWMFLLWCSGVGGLFIIALIIRFMLTSAGLTS
ncbi:DUF2474 family protein [Wohlfahrtiimonas larvae]|nr:DUF2474 family protein [Wohlfahrtiimonas larvae]